jgi:hypothetical protein
MPLFLSIGNFFRLSAFFVVQQKEKNQAASRHIFEMVNLYNFFMLQKLSEKFFWIFSLSIE